MKPGRAPSRLCALRFPPQRSARHRRDRTCSPPCSPRRRRTTPSNGATLRTILTADPRPAGRSSGQRRAGANTSSKVSDAARRPQLPDAAPAECTTLADRRKLGKRGLQPRTSRCVHRAAACSAEATAAGIRDGAAGPKVRRAVVLARAFVLLPQKNQNTNSTSLITEKNQTITKIMFAQQGRGLGTPASKSTRESNLKPSDRKDRTPGSTRPSPPRRQEG